ncbi:HEPN domain-containing protein [bacterium]|nr:HEPN domain-containing protein [bacterium]
MNRKDLQQLSNLRIRESRLLISNGYYSGGYYLAGYAIECALKACITKQIKKHDFPDKKLVNEIYTHDLAKLIESAGLTPKLRDQLNKDREFDLNWAVVKDWSERERYNHSIAHKKARDLYRACTSRKHGVLTWLKKSW